ncbi:hypothetical protein ACA910_012485 [Epithemia clementina (nom. ined.)]
MSNPGQIEGFKNQPLSTAESRQITEAATTTSRVVPEERSSGEKNDLEMAVGVMRKGSADCGSSSMQRPSCSSSSRNSSAGATEQIGGNQNNTAGTQVKRTRMPGDGDFDDDKSTNPRSAPALISSSSLVTPPVGSMDAASPHSIQPTTTMTTRHNMHLAANQGESGQAMVEDMEGSAPVFKARHGFCTDIEFVAYPAPSVTQDTQERNQQQRQQSTNAQQSLVVAPQPPRPIPPTTNQQLVSTGKPRGVPHVYHDFAQVRGPGPAFVRKKTGGVTQPFPEKLHEMLDHEANDDPSTAIVSWLPHGRAFIVRKPKEFTTQIMPKYFRQTKLTSFQRQLNLYGFRRITQGADAGAYYHEMFLQGRPSLSQQMVRQKVKGTGHKQPADVSSEPNFYAMSPVEPESNYEFLGFQSDSLPRHPGAPPAPGLGSFQSDSNTETSLAPPGAPLAPGLPTTSDPSSTTTRNSQHSLPDRPTLQERLTSTPDSPGFVSLQGAAHLLHGFASSLAGSNTPFLGPAAASAQSAPAVSANDATGNKATTNSIQDRKRCSKGTPASFLPSQGTT